MNYVIRFLQSTDILSLIVLLLVSYYAGAFIAHGNQRCLAAGKVVGVAIGLVCIALQAIEFQSATTGNWVPVVIRGVMLGIFSMFATWVTLPLLIVIYDQTLGRIQRAIAAQCEQSAQARRKLEEQRQWKERQRDAESAERRAASIREQNRAEEELRQQERARTQKRRDDARSRSELLYTLFAPDVAKRFTRSMFDSFLVRYMGDSTSVAEIEERERQLLGILEEHRSVVRPEPRFRNLDDIARWYSEEKQRIENLPIDPNFRDEYLVRLSYAYTDLTDNFLESQLR